MSKINWQKTVDALYKRGKLRLHKAGNGVQWVANDEAMFPLIGFPALTPATFAAAFSLPPDAVTDDGRPGMIPELEDVAQCENLILLERVQLQPFGEAHASFLTSAGTVFVPEYYKKLMPEGINSGVYERVTNGELYIVFKDGMKVCGILLPRAIKRRFSEEWMEALTETYTHLSRFDMIE